VVKDRTSRKVSEEEITDEKYSENFLRQVKTFPAK
jgi:hypothetical protein